MALIAPFVLTLLLHICLPYPAPSRHLPVLQRWEIVNPVTQGIITSLSSSQWPRLTWFPPIAIDLCALAFPPGVGPGSHYCLPYYRRGPPPPTQDASLWPIYPLYGCPGFRQPQHCGSQSDGFCAAWGCVTIGTAPWIAKDKDLITLNRNFSRPSTCSLKPPNCNPLIITFTNRGKQDTRWTDGLTWGLRLYKLGIDDVVLFTLRLRIQPLTVLVGPFLPRPLPPRPFPSRTTTSPAPAPLVPSSPTVPAMPSPSPLSTADRLFSLVVGAYIALNVSNPNLTSSCWLCLHSQPPYYEGIAYNATPARSLCRPPPPVAPHPLIALHSLQSLARAYALVLSPIPTPISAPLPSLLHPPHISSRPPVTPFGPATQDSPHVSPSRFSIPPLNSVFSSSYGPASPTVWMMLFCHFFPHSIEYVENPSLLSLSSLVLVASPRALAPAPPPSYRPNIWLLSIGP